MKTGWWNPNPRTKHPTYHYVGVDGKTLCYRWRYTGNSGEIEVEHDEFAKENCAQCRKKRAEEH